MSCQSFPAHAWIWAQLMCGSVWMDRHRRLQSPGSPAVPGCSVPAGDSMPTPCLVSALCPLWPRPEPPPPSCADLRVHSCLWVHDQRESQQHHDDPAGAHSAAEQVPSKSGPGQPRPRCWWFAVLLGRGLAKAMAPSRRLSEVSSAELAGEMLWEFKQREGRGGSLGICVGGTGDVVTARGPFLSLPS